MTPDKAPASLAQIAKAAGVSLSTVSRIANGELGRASAKTVAKVQALITSMDYRPSPLGRALRRRESQLIAMLVPNLDNPAMAAIAASTEKALREAGFVMIMCDTHDEAALQDEYLAAMRAQLVRGYVLVSAVASPGLSALMKRGDPMVFVNRRNPMGAGTFVGIDNIRAGAMAADHLLALHPRTIGMLQPQNLSHTIAERLKGCRQRLEEAGIAPAALRSASGAGSNHLECGYSAIQALASGGWPDALFCPSDLMAYAAYRFAGESGIMVPRDMGLIGIDDNRLNDWIANWLTSVAIPYQAFGAEIVAAFNAIWNGGPIHDRLLDCHLVTRPSAPV